jgi:non-specific serine/threonine protein kinase
MPRASAFTPEKFATFGELLRFLRRKANLTQRELSIAVGYSESQISRLEQNERAPEEATLAARFVPALYIDDEPEWIARLLDLGASTHAHTSEAGTLQPIAEAKPTPHNLPIQLTSFIGREKEIIEIWQHISQARLVSLTGSGGCGKSRLALQVASGLLDLFPHGVWLVELAPLADPTLVPQTVAVVLGVEERTNRPILSKLIDHLRGKRILLILDNCEHLLQASAQLAESLLHSCPDVHILATSRETLEVAGERVFLVPSLSCPDPARPIQADSLPQYESVRLFLDRAQMSMPGFTLTDDNAFAVAQVCHRLDGIPLAIELAAARVKLLRVKQIAERLDDRFQLLTTGSHTSLPRHQTLAALIDWSHDLLSEPERILLRRLSVFAGGWTLQAAESICVGDGIEAVKILDLLTQLVNKSLVLAGRAQGEETRYSMLETIRQYSLEKLMGSGEMDVIRRQHAEYYLAEIQARNPPRSLPDWLDPTALEHDNFRAALLWSLQADEGIDIGLRLVNLIWLFWYSRGYWREGIAWLERTVAHSKANQYPALRADALDALGYLHALQNHYATAQAYVAESLRLFQELGDLGGTAGELYRQGSIARLQGDTTCARLRLEESLAMFRKLGYKHAIAETLNPLGDVLIMQEDPVGATVLLEESLASFQEEGDLNGNGWALNHLGLAALIQGKYERATWLLEKSLLLFRKIGPKHLGVPWAFQGLGETALAQGDTLLATKHLAEALTLFRDLGDQAGVSWCLAGLAGVAALEEDPERAAWLWGAAEALRQSIGARHAPAARLTHERLQSEARKQLGEEIFNTKWAEGQAASVEEAVIEALS